MSRKSSVHIEAGKVGEFFHNSRETPTANSIFDTKNNYCNLTARKALALYSRELQLRTKLYTQKTHKKLHKNTKTLMTSIINLDKQHTKKDVEKVVKLLEQKLNTKVVQYAVHRDEGHTTPGGEKKVNYHAHILFMGLDNNGMSVRRKLDKKMLRELQTEVAQVLGMERGKEFSKAKRLDTYEYKEHAKKQATATKTLKEKIKNLEAENKQLKKENTQLKKENKELQISVKDLKTQISELRKEMIENNKDQEIFTKEDYQTLSLIKKQLNAKNVQEIHERLQNFDAYIRKQIKDNTKRLLEKYSEERGLVKKELVISTETAMKIINTTCNTNKYHRSLEEFINLETINYKLQKKLEQANKKLAVLNNNNIDIILRKNKELELELEKQKDITREKEYLIQQLQQQLSENKINKSINDNDINYIDRF